MVHVQQVELVSKVEMLCYAECDIYIVPERRKTTTHIFRKFGGTS